MPRLGPKARNLLASAATLLATLLIVVWSVGPILIMFRAALTEPRFIFSVEQSFLAPPTFQNFINLWNEAPEFFVGIRNSVIITAGATILAVALSTLAGYAYSRWRSRALSVSQFWLIAVRLMPPIVLTLPLFPIINWLRLSDTHFTLVVLYTAFIVSLGTLVMRTVIDQIPQELDEAAVADGAGPFQIFRRIIVPLCRQGMVAVSVFVIVFAWNEYLFAFLFSTKIARTAPIAISEMLTGLDGAKWGLVFASTTLQLIPILLFVILTRDYLLKGVTAGSVKG